MTWKDELNGRAGRVASGWTAQPSGGDAWWLGAWRGNATPLRSRVSATEQPPAPGPWSVSPPHQQKNQPPNPTRPRTPYPNPLNPRRLEPEARNSLGVSSGLLRAALLLCWDCFVRSSHLSLPSPAPTLHRPLPLLFPPALCLLLGQERGACEDAVESGSGNLEDTAKPQNNGTEVRAC